MNYETNPNLLERIGVNAVFNSQSNICETKTAASLTAGDEVLIRMNGGVVQEVICFEK